MNYTRENLIEICKQSFVSYKIWNDRDSLEAQKQLGVALVLLTVGCPFKILDEGTLKTDDHTIWLEIKAPGFGTFESGEIEDESYFESDNYYLPTEKRLKDRQGSDWY